MRGRHLFGSRTNRQQDTGGMTMSVAWEVTVDDIAIVLMRKNIAADPDEVFDEHFAGDTCNCGRVERAVLVCTDFDDQCDAALAEIEAILTEVGVIRN
jgi:hypothetical protein